MAYWPGVIGMSSMRNMTKQEKVTDLKSRIKRLEKCIEVMPEGFCPSYTVARLAQIDQELTKLQMEMK